MTIDGVELDPRAVEELALRLHWTRQHALAAELGVALENRREGLELADDERSTIVRVLARDCPPALDELRAELAATLRAAS